MSLPAVLRSSDVAERGTYIHKFLEHVLRGMPRALALTRVPEELRDTCRNIDHKRATGDLDPSRLRAEVSFGINVYAAEAIDLGSGLDRGYPAATMGDVFGTTDVYGFSTWEEHPVVVDWKTGFDDVAPTRENPQLLFAATAAALLTGAARVEGRIAYVRPSGKVDIDRWEWDAFDIECFLEDLASIYDKALAAKEQLRLHVLPPLRPADYCTYCPAFPACPAQVSLARALIPELTDVNARVAILSPEQAGKAWRTVAAAEKLAETIRAALKTMARRVPLPTDEGHEVREIRFPQRRFDRKRALELLHQYGATEEEIASCEPKVELSQIRELKKVS